MRALRALAAVAGLAALLAGCGSSGGSGAGRISGSLLRVYSSQPLVGPLADQGRDLVRAQQLALTEAGDRAGRFRVAYTALNNASPKTGTWDPAVVSADARRAAQDPHTIAYLGEMDTGASAVSIPILNEVGILQVSPTDGVAGLTRARGAGPGEPEKYYPARDRNFVRLVPPDDLQAQALVELLRMSGVRRLYLLHDEGLYGQRLGLAVARSAGAAGIVLVRSRGIDARRVDPRDVAEDVAGNPADGLLYAGSAAETVPALLAAIHAAAPRLALFGPSALADDGFVARLGPAGARLRLVAPWPPTRGLPAAGRRFARAFRSRYGVAPTPTAVYGYESMRLVLAAVRRAGREGDDRATVTRAAFGLSPPGSALGAYAIDPAGDTSLRRFAVYAVRGGRLAFLRTLEPAGTP